MPAAGIIHNQTDPALRTAQLSLRGRGEGTESPDKSVEDNRATELGNQLEVAGFGLTKFCIIDSSVLRVPLGCLEELGMILEGTWAQHLKIPSHILERSTLKQQQQCFPNESRERGKNKTKPRCGVNVS